VTFEKLWEQVVAKNPVLTTAETVTLRPVEFKRAMELAYTQGSKMATGAAEGLLRDLIKNGKEILGKGTKVS